MMMMMVMVMVMVMVMMTMTMTTMMMMTMTMVPLGATRNWIDCCMMEVLVASQTSKYMMSDEGRNWTSEEKTSLIRVAPTHCR